MMRFNTLRQTLGSRVKATIGIALATFFLAAGVVLSGAERAIATPIGSPILASAQQQAEQALDDVAGAGTSNQIKGRVEEGVGRLQQQAGKTSTQLEGAARQAKGRVQRGVGEAQGAVEDAADEAQDKADSFIDSVKDFFD